MKIQTCLTDPPSPPCHTRCMYMSRMIRLVVPRHAGLDLLQIDVLAIDDHLAEDALIPVILAVVHLDRLPGDQIGQMLLCMN